MLTPAQETAAVDSSQRALAGYYVIPEIPATSLLGVAPASIARPSTTKDLATSMINGVDADGRVRQGLALEFSAGMAAPFRVPLSVYQGSARARFWSNLLVSFATARTAGDSGSTDLAWGLRAPIIDGGDPLAKPAYTQRLGRAMLKCAPKSPPNFIPPNTGQSQAQLDSQSARLTELLDALNAAQAGCLSRAASEIGKQAAESLWNAPRLVLAYSGSLRLNESRFADRSRIADRVWLVGAMPLSRLAGPMPFAGSTQAIGYLDFTRTHAGDTIPAFTAWRFGARLNTGSSAVNLFGEFLWEGRSNPPPGLKSSARAWSGGVEVLAAEGVWISTGLGKRAEALLETDKAVFIANIRWGVASKTFLSPTP